MATKDKQDTATLVETTIGQFEARMSELEPAVQEYNELAGIVRSLTGKSKSTGTGTGKRGRPRGSGSRAAEFLDLVTKNPGITIPEIADAMGIKQNYLYRVAGQLAEDGKIEKVDQGYHVAATA